MACAPGGFEVLNRVVVNQVLVRDIDEARTDTLREAAAAIGETWFGPALWQGRRAFRLSISNWQPDTQHIDTLVALLARLRSSPG